MRGVYTPQTFKPLFLTISQKKLGRPYVKIVFCVEPFYDLKIQDKSFSWMRKKVQKRVVFTFL